MYNQFRHGQTRPGEQHPQSNCYIFQGVPFIAISFPYFLQHLINAVVRILNVNQTSSVSKSPLVIQSEVSLIKGRLIKDIPSAFEITKY